MYLLIIFDPINFVIGSGIFAGMSVAVYKVIVGYFQKDKDKMITVKIDENGQIETTFKGYSMKDVRILIKETLIKMVNKEPLKSSLRLIKSSKSK